MDNGFLRTLLPNLLTSSPVQTVIPLEVSLLNDRTYVQGSQILARLCEAPELNGAMLDHAKFLHLTNRLVAALPEGTPHYADARLVGVVGFLQDEAPQSFDIMELAQPAPVVKRPQDLLLQDLEHDGKLSGRCRFQNASGVQGLLDALIQAIKSLHQLLPEPTTDIWFTGLRQLRLTAPPPAMTLAGTVEVRCLRRKGDDVLHQSLLRASIRAETGDAGIDGLVTFAWRTPEGIHVA